MFQGLTIIDGDTCVELRLFYWTVKITKSKILNALPFSTEELTIRTWNRADLDIMAEWAGYPFPYDIYNVELRTLDSSQRDFLFKLREVNPYSVTLVADHTRQKTIGYLALFDLNYGKQEVGNMGVRMSPDWCDRGVGSRLIDLLANWCIECGLNSLRLDVAAWNARAIRCYEKAGFKPSGEEFRREVHSYDPVDMDNERYDFLRDHFELSGEVVKVRHLWLERKYT